MAGPQSDELLSKEVVNECSAIGLATALRWPSRFSYGGDRMLFYHVTCQAVSDMHQPWHLLYALRKTHLKAAALSFYRVTKQLVQNLPFTLI